MNEQLISLKNIIFSLERQPEYVDRAYQCSAVITYNLINDLNIIKNTNWFDGFVYINNELIDIDDISEYIGQNCIFSLTGISEYFANNIKEYITRNNASLLQNSSLGYFFIYKDKYAYGDKVVPNDIQCFLNIHKYIFFLKEIGDYSDNNTIVFISSERITVNIDLTTVLLETHIKHLDDMLNSFKKTDKHYDEKKRILKKIIVSVLSNLNTNEYFNCLCMRLDTIYLKFIDNYYLFIESIDIDKVVKDTREKKVKYISELNKVFSETRNILILLPAFISFILFLYNRTPNDNQNYLYDSIFIICFILYYIFLWIFIYNHEKYVGYIENEIQCYIRELKELYCSCTIQDKLSPHVSELDDNIRTINNLFKAINTILAIIGFMFWFFIVYKYL